MDHFPQMEAVPAAAAGNLPLVAFMSSPHVVRGTSLNDEFTVGTTYFGDPSIFIQNSRDQKQPSTFQWFRELCTHDASPGEPFQFWSNRICERIPSWKAVKKDEESWFRVIRLYEALAANDRFQAVMTFLAFSSQMSAKSFLNPWCKWNHSILSEPDATNGDLYRHLLFDHSQQVAWLQCLHDHHRLQNPAWVLLLNSMISPLQFHVDSFLVKHVLRPLRCSSLKSNEYVIAIRNGAKDTKHLQKNRDFFVDEIGDEIQTPIIDRTSVKSFEIVRRALTCEVLSWLLNGDVSCALKERFLSLPPSWIPEEQQNSDSEFVE
jgi:hypothetical protein